MLKPVRGRLADKEDKEWMCLTGRTVGMADGVPCACSGQCKGSLGLRAEIFERRARRYVIDGETDTAESIERCGDACCI